MGMSIASIGYYLPDNAVTNDHLLELVATNGGNREKIADLKRKLLLNKADVRYFKHPEQGGVEMAEEAARRCLAKAGFPAEELDLILYVGMLREYVEPAMSIILQARLKAAKAHAFDISNACNGFINGLELADLYIASGKFKHILIVGAENGSERIPWHHMSSDERAGGFSALTIADGAAAMLLRADANHPGFTEFDFITYGQYHDLCLIKIGKESDDLKIMVKSKRLAMTALKILPEYIESYLHKARRTLGKIDIWFPHQVTGDPSKFFEKLDEDLNRKVYNTFDKVGNTGSISIPLGMALAEEAGRLKRGDCVAAVVGASGFSCGATSFVY